MVSLSLTRMVEGGINDQVGSSFCRYSVDRIQANSTFRKKCCTTMARDWHCMNAQQGITSGDKWNGRIANESVRELGC